MRFLLLFMLGWWLLALSACGNQAEPTDVGTSTDTLARGTEAYYNQLIARFPNNPEAYYGRALRYQEVGHFDKAIADLEQAIRLAPDSAIYVYALSDLYMSARDPNLQLPDSWKAIETLKRFIATHPTHEDAQIELADVLLTLAQYREMHDLLDKLLKANPYNPDAWFYKGIAYSFAGDTPLAIRQLQASLEIDPEAPNVHYELGLLFDRSNSNLAMSYYDNVLRLDSNFTDARYMKGFALQNLGRYEEAMAIYRDIIYRDKRYAKAHYNMGYIWYVQDTVDKALRSFERALGVDPTYVNAYYMRGLMSELLGDLDRAIADYRQTLNLDPRHRLAADGLDRLKHLQ